MAVGADDLKLYAAAAMPNDDVSSNGGAIDAGAEITGALDEVFIDAYSKDTGEGNRIVYRKVFFKNTSGTDLTEAKIWMSADEHDLITLDLESAVDGSDASTNRITAPSNGYVFAEHNTEETAHAIPGGTLGAGEAIGVWLKLIIPEDTSPDASVTATLKIKGQTIA